MDPARTPFFIMPQGYTPVSLARKNALVTGAGSGIGRAIAEAFARAGARIWVADRDPAGGKATVARLRKAGSSSTALDVTGAP